MMKLTKYSIKGFIVGVVICLLFTLLVGVILGFKIGFLVGITIGSFFGSAVTGFLAAKEGRIESIFTEGAKMGLWNTLLFCGFSVLFSFITKSGNQNILLAILSFVTNMMTFIIIFMESMIGVFAGIWASTLIHAMPALVNSAKKCPDYLETKTKLMKRELKKSSKKAPA